MKILFITVVYNYPGSDNMYADLLSEFKKNGHEICVICARQKRENLPTQLCNENDIPVLRVKTGNLTGSVGLLKKGIASLTVDGKFKSAIRKYYGKMDFDMVIYTTPPIMLRKTVKSVSRRTKAVVCHILKDIFPQTAVDLGVLSEKNPIYKYYRHCEKKIYKMDDILGCTSQRNIDYILSHNDIDKDKVIMVRNSITPRDEWLFKDDGELRKELGIKETDTLFLFGGNLGKPQAIDFLTEFVLRLTKNENIFVAVLGSGTAAKDFCDRIKEENAKRIFYHSFLPKDEYLKYLKACDVGMIFLDSHYTVPNNPLRFTAYMEASLPMLAATDCSSDIGEWLSEYNLGYWVESKEENIDELTRMAVNMANNPELRAQMGKNSRELLMRDYLASQSYQTIIDKYADLCKRKGQNKE